MNKTLGICCVLLALLPVRVQAQMQYPLSVAATDAGLLYVADRDVPGVWKVDAGELTAYFTGSKKFRTPLNAVRCLALDRSGALLAGDTSTREVYRFDKDGKPVPLTNGGIGMPMALAVNSRGEILVADLELHRIFKVPEQGGKPEQVAEVPAPRGVCSDSEDRLWVVSHGKNQIVRVLTDGKIETVVEGRPFQFPHTIVLDAEKTAYVADGYAKAIWKIPPGGKPEKWVSGEPLINPVGLARNKAGMWIVDPHAKAVFQVSPDGKLTRVEAKTGG
jgi:sugar lactone lactonase YvrE